MPEIDGWGDQDDLARLFRRYHGRLVRYLRGFTGDQGVAEQLAQTTWVQLGVALADGVASPVGSGEDARLLFHIARCRAMDWWRAQGRHPETTFSAFEGGVVDRVLLEHGSAVLAGLGRSAGAGAADLVERRLDVLAALRRLPRRQKEVMALHYLLDLTLEETAAILGISVNTAKTQLGRARRALRSEPALVGYDEGRTS